VTRTIQVVCPGLLWMWVHNSCFEREGFGIAVQALTMDDLVIFVYHF